MSEDLQIVAEPRTALGKTACRRLRRQGLIPASMYGHGQHPVSLSLKEDDFRSVLSTGHKVVDIKLGTEVQKVLVRDLQWDTYSKQVQHIDLIRVDATERMRVEVPIELRGTAPGVIAGGLLEQPLHSLQIEASVASIPDQITIRIHDLQIGQSLHVSDITDLPADIVIETPGDLVVVQVSERVEVEVAASDEEEGAPAQPELVGRAKEEEAIED